MARLRPNSSQASLWPAAAEGGTTAIPCLAAIAYAGRRAQEAAIIKGLQFVLGVGLALGVATGARAAPPPGVVVDPATKEWFDNLRSSQGWACCDFSHCRAAAVAPNDDGRVFAFIDKKSFGPNAPDAWREVPLPELRVRGNRPPGVRGAIICYDDNRVLCADLEPAT